MSIEFDKTIAMLGGQSVNSYLETQLSERDKTQINNAIELIFSGLSLKNWLDGGTLGEAWSKALDSVREITFAITNKNPAVTYAQAETFRHRTRWKSTIVMSHDATKTIKCPADQRDNWYAQANEKTQNGIEILRNKIAAFESVTPRKPVVSIQKTINFELTRQQERENERELERTK
ncbi:MAG: hypothetical protein UIH99_01870 [Alphaproteobacteria bacterium]|nr:hypothetical protein [Alphaproteobacteria bacterium]